MPKAKRNKSTKQSVIAVKANAQPRILNCVPSRQMEDDWTITNALAVGAAAGAIPVAKDLRQAWWDIGNQGSTGSCVGWASADSVLRWHFTRAGKLTPAQHLSPRFQWMASKETDEFVSPPTTFIEQEGTSLKAALDIARKYGAVPDKLLPFNSGALYQGDTKTFFANAAQFKIASYFNLDRDLPKWRQWIATEGPILTRLDVDSTWDAADDTKGVLAIYNPATTRGGHAVALVGYDANMFIVRNSWGTNWGDKGFAYASNAYATAAFTEAYGVRI